jgi:pyruvate/2-oxoglutarate dehydrogenase complex dihydrolipoamide dehydrogenase (E3) component
VAIGGRAESVRPWPELTLAITNKLPMKALAETVHCYPTQAEVFQRIALAYGK